MRNSIERKIQITGFLIKILFKNNRDFQAWSGIFWGLLIRQSEKFSIHLNFSAFRDSAQDKDSSLGFFLYFGILYNRILRKPPLIKSFKSSYRPRFPSGRVGCLRLISCFNCKKKEILFCDWPKPIYATRWRTRTISQYELRSRGKRNATGVEPRFFTTFLYFQSAYNLQL